MITALYIDDCEFLLKMVSQYLMQNEDLSIETATSSGEASAMLRNRDYDMLIMDYNLKCGLETGLIHQIRKEGRSVPVIFFTLETCHETEERIRSLGNIWFVRKCSGPASGISELERTIRKDVLPLQGEN